MHIAEGVLMKMMVDHVEGLQMEMRGKTGQSRVTAKSTQAPD